MANLAIVKAETQEYGMAFENKYDALRQEENGDTKGTMKSQQGQVLRARMTSFLDPLKETRDEQNVPSMTSLKQF